METQLSLPRCRFRSRRRNQFGHHDCLSPLLVHSIAGASDNTCWSCPYVDLTEEAWMRSRGLDAVPGGKRVHNDPRYRNMIINAKAEDFDDAVLRPLRQEVMLVVRELRAHSLRTARSPLPIVVKDEDIDESNTGFPADSIILTTVGEAPIQNMKAGNAVLATANGRTDTVTTVLTGYRGLGEVCVFDTDRGRLIVGRGQLLLLDNDTFTLASRIEAGAVLAFWDLAGRSRARVARAFSLPTPVTLFSPIMAEPYTFIASGLIAHNKIMQNAVPPGTVRQPGELPGVRTGVTPPPIPKRQ